MSADMLPDDVSILFQEARARLFREPLAERTRIGLAMALRTLAETSEKLSAQFETAPYEDYAFEAVNRELAVALTVASQNVDAWRQIRDCYGEA